MGVGTLFMQCVFLIIHNALARKQSYEMEGGGGVIRMREDGLFLIYAQVITTKVLLNLALCHLLST